VKFSLVDILQGDLGLYTMHLSIVIFLEKLAVVLELAALLCISVLTAVGWWLIYI